MLFLVASLVVFIVGIQTRGINEILSCEMRRKWLNVPHIGPFDDLGGVTVSTVGKYIPGKNNLGNELF